MYHREANFVFWPMGTILLSATCFGVELVLRNTERRGNDGLEEIEIEHLEDMLGEKCPLRGAITSASVEMDCGDEQRDLNFGE